MSEKGILRLNEIDENAIYKRINDMYYDIKQNYTIEKKARLRKMLEKEFDNDILNILQI